jgi:hypothetical protein
MVMAWSPVCGGYWEVVELLGERAWWEEIRTLGVCP